MDIILFGAGKRALKLLSFPLKPENKILFVCDNDQRKVGNTIQGYTIVSPEEIRKTVFDYILISTVYDISAIREQLIGMQVDASKILLSNDLGNIEFCEGELDKIFKIDKIQPQPFVKGPAPIYRLYRGETFKAHDRREREGFFEKYCCGDGLDIGYGADPVTPTCSGWDIVNGDAQYLKGIEDESFDFVYSSHCLEHMVDVQISLHNWFRVVKHGGYLILAIPHRDLYEKRKTLPSRWNADHKHMFLLGRAEMPDTMDILQEIRNSLEHPYEIQYAKICDEGHTITDPLIHSDGEYQIEIVIKKM